MIFESTGHCHVSLCLFAVCQCAALTMRAAGRSKKELAKKSCYSHLNGTILQKKSRSEKLFMHPYRRMSFNLALFFCGKAPQAEALRLLEDDLDKKLGLPALLHCLISVLSFTSCPGGLPNRAQTVHCVFKP